MKRPVILVCVFVVIGVFTVDVSAFQLRNIAQQEDYTGSIPGGIAVDPDGRLSISGQLVPVWESDTEPAAWTVTADSNAVYAATADDGKVYRYKNNKIELLFDSPQIAIISLLSVPGTGLLAGSAPDGIIYRIDDSGMASVFYRTNASYVWSMTLQDRNTLLVATGLPASVVRINLSGEHRETVSVTASHVRAMAQDTGGGIWLGTADPARIYSLNGADLQLVYEANAAEISAMAAGKDGIWFSTVASPAISDSWSERAERLRPGIPRSSPATERNAVWFIDSRRSIYEVWSTTAIPVFDMIVVNNKPHVVCGGKGFLFRIDDIGRSTLLASRQNAPLTCLTLDSSGVIWAGGATNAGLFRFDPEPGDTGSIESAVIDAGITAEWGRFMFRGDHLTDRSVQFSSRTGNTEIPDNEWSEWVLADSDGKIASPPGRFLQWKAVLNRHRNQLPVIDTVSISLKTANRPPYITRVTVHPVVKGELIEQPGRGRMFQQTMPDGLRIDFVLPAGVFNGLSKGTWMQLRGMRTVTWDAGDPDNDPLVYRLEMTTASGKPDWFILEDNVTQPVYSFDSTAYSDGWYRIRVIASDKSANPLGDCLATERLSPPFEIDNTPPVFQDVRAVQTTPASNNGWRLQITGTAVDNGKRISRLEYSLDTKLWFDFTSEDGMLDQPVERFDITLEGGKTERFPHQVFLRVTDHHENIATTSVAVK